MLDPKTLLMLAVGILLLVQGVSARAFGPFQKRDTSSEKWEDEPPLTPEPGPNGSEPSADADEG